MTDHYVNHASLRSRPPPSAEFDVQAAEAAVDRALKQLGRTGRRFRGVLIVEPRLGEVVK